ncbi:hypothetical protein B0T21DRAFT_382057 [Apiosordaria backusii]|uniref:Impact N-terminal domain-containing protein n=1 Tax=Apiosordaria backusii TaxID=314023 RepID=A0AA40K1H6_9PEZI|nr:hypothetical protein B0T21DRAFT_382057 [Apiosordaria backusii]
MATQQDLQDLIRLMTVTRKMPMLQAMTSIKALQAVDLRSIKQISEAPLPTVQAALKDDKIARALQNACKAVIKRNATPSSSPPSGGGALKRESSLSSTSPAAKRAKSDIFMVGPIEMTPQELEASLELPICTDEERIKETVIETNRAPLVLAFAVEMLRYTMPEQPLSSRLSLAQAVVSANSRSKAVSLGLDKGPSADQEGYGEGQPRVRVMGREIAVLKRSGYEWKGEEKLGGEDKKKQGEVGESQATTATMTSTLGPAPTPTATWSTSQPISMKDSKFVARAIQVTEPSQRRYLMESLLYAHPELKSATHNAWAYRLKPPENGNWLSQRIIREESFDDGETGCGELMLKVMREAGAVDTLVVLTRWFGGTMLGPDRWRLMRNVVTSALSERMRKTGGSISLGGEALWGLDLEAMRKNQPGTTVGGYGSGKQLQPLTHVVGMHIHRPEAARSYLLRSFGKPSPPADETATSPAKKKAVHKTAKALEAEKEENLGLLLGALRLLFDSWADHLDVAELDRRTWAWYCAIRPEVDSGPNGWGGKGAVKLVDILNLRRGHQT